MPDVVITPNDESVDAMVIALQVHGVALVDRVRPGEALSQEHLRIVLGSALAAGASHLAQLAPPPGPVEAPEGSRQWVMEEAYLQMIRSQQRAADLQAEHTEQQAELMVAARALTDEQFEVARMQRERLALDSWQRALAIAGQRVTGPVTGEGSNATQAQVLAEAGWFVWHLDNPSPF